MKLKLSRKITVAVQDLTKRLIVRACPESTSRFGFQPHSKNILTTPERLQITSLLNCSIAKLLTGFLALSFSFALCQVQSCTWLCTLIFALLSTPAYAASVSWDGRSAGKWNTGSNWINNQV